MLNDGGGLVVCLRNNRVLWRPSASRRCVPLPQRTLRVRLRQRALRGTPLPRHTTPPLHRQTRKWSVCATTWCVLAVIGVPSLRSASSTYRCGYAFVSGPCEEHRCLAIPHRHYTDRRESGLSAQRLGVFWRSSASRRCVPLPQRTLRVRLRQRALRGTPLPRHTTPPFHRQTTRVETTGRLRHGAAGCRRRTGYLVFPAREV